MPDPYLYPETNILINKFNIKNAERLVEVENDLVYIKLFDVDEFLDGCKFNAATLKALHRHLFEDIYTWAGEFRTINIRKYERVLPGASVDYYDHTAIKKELDAAMKGLEAIAWQKMSLLERVSAFSRLFARIWKIHPFREGNTRTVTTFMLGYAKQQQINMDGSLLSKYNAYVRDSLVMASIGEYSEYDHLEKIILDAMGGVENTQENMDVSDKQEKYTHINEYDVSEYYYRQFDAETDK
ncbi:MAG: Fic family protein [Bacillota bacterium]